RGTVHQLLINEKYIGNNVWARTSCKLKGEHVENAPEDWVRANGVFDAIIPAPMFDAAQTLIAKRSEKLSDDQMLAALSQIFAQRGFLSGLIIDEANDCPSSSAFRSRFGSLLRAYTLVGFAPDHDYRYLEINRRLRAIHPGILDGIIRGIEQTGGSVVRDQETDLLRINGEFSVSVTIARCFQTSAGGNRWKLRLDTKLRPDITLAVRMDADNEIAQDYYLLPALDMREATLRLADFNGLSLDAYRFDTLEFFYRLTARVPLRAAA
ncbi:MAG: recombinase family protein, partial [Erythrobacter sp.]|nr:recombinase family protein [Erythrobacter sp.]